MKKVIVSFLILISGVFITQIQAQNGGDFESLIEQLKKEALSNRALFEQFVSPEMLNQIFESLDEIDMNDLKEQLQGVDMNDLFNSPLLKGFSFESFDLNKLFETDLLELFDFNPPSEGEQEDKSEKGKVKI